MKKKIIDKKIKKNTILSVFDNIQDKKLTLLQWIKALYKNGKIEEVKVIAVNDGVALKVIFIDGTYITSETIPTLNQAQLDALINAVAQLREDLNTEINDRELADSELQHDIDNHTSNNTIHVTQANKDAWNNKLDSAIVSASVSGSTLTLTYEDGQTVTFTAGGESSAVWGNISGSIDNQIDLHNALNSKANEDDLIEHEDNNIRHITAEERTAWNGKEEQAQYIEISTTTGTLTEQQLAILTASNRNFVIFSNAIVLRQIDNEDGALVYSNNDTVNTYGLEIIKSTRAYTLTYLQLAKNSDLTAEIQRSTGEDSAILSALNIHTTNSYIHITNDERASWNNKQTKLYRHNIYIHGTDADHDNKEYSINIILLLRYYDNINNFSSLLSAFSGGYLTLCGGQFGNSNVKHTPTTMEKTTSTSTDLLVNCSDGAQAFVTSSGASIIVDTVTEL